MTEAVGELFGKDREVWPLAKEALMAVNFEVSRVHSRPGLFLSLSLCLLPRDQDVYRFIYFSSTKPAASCRDWSWSHPLIL